jgi:hypothetical protein
MIPEAIQKRTIAEKNSIKELETHKKNICDILQKIIIQHQDKQSIVQEVPVFIRGYEKYIAQRVLQKGYRYIILYNEKNIIYIEINPTSKNTDGPYIKDLLAKSGFKGKQKETIFEGMVERLDLFIV